MSELSYLNNQHSWNNESDIVQVVKDLNDNNQLETLIFTGNTLGVEAAECLTEALSNQKSLKTLKWNDLFTGRGKAEISKCLTSLSLGLMKAQVNLVELDLSDNAFGPNGVIGVAELLSSSCCYTLKVLNMNNQGLGQQGCRILVDSLKKGRLDSEYKGLNLEIFIAGRNRLENAGMEMLAEVFGDGMCSLKKLIFLQNGIGIHGIEGVENFVKIIEKHTNLEYLDISDNTIKYDGLIKICDIMENFPKLKTLRLDDCLLKNKGIMHLCQTLENPDVCGEIKTISITGNEINSKNMIQFITSILESKEHIETLDIRDNNVKKASKQEINELLNDYQKGDVLVKEEPNEGDEDDGDEEDDDDDDGDDDSEEDSDEDDEDESDNEATDSENFVDIGGDKREPNGFLTTTTNELILKTPDKPNIFVPPPVQTSLFGSPAVKETSLFSKPLSNPTSLFGNSINTPSNLFGQSGSNKTNLFGNNTSNQTPVVVKTSIFGNPQSTTQSNLFEAPVSNPTNLFGNKVEQKSSLFGNTSNTQSNLFGTSTTTSLFGNQNTKFDFIPSQNSLFMKTSIPPVTTTITTTTTIQNTSNDDKTKFSFLTAANTSNDDKTKFSFLTAAASNSLVNNRQILKEALLKPNFDDSKLIFTKSKDINLVQDKELLNLLYKNPESAIRIGLYLSSDSNLLDQSIELIVNILNHESCWSRATNALLVEMECLKSEEKKFVPICNNLELFIQVISRLMKSSNLSTKVKSNLITVIKSLKRRKETDVLINELDASMKTITI